MRSKRKTLVKRPGKTPTDGPAHAPRASVKRAGAALRESEERFRLLVENAPGAVFVQTQHRFAYLNPAALRCFGAESPGQLLGQPVLDRFDARFHEQVNERMRLLNEEKKTVPTLEQIYLKVDGGQA